MPVKNYCYGVRWIEDQELVENTLRECHKYRNKLCEIEHQRRSYIHDRMMKLDKPYAKVFKEVELLEVKLDEHRAKIKKARAKQRSRKPVGVEELIKETKKLASDLKEKRAEQKKLKKVAYKKPEVVEMLAESSKVDKQKKSELAKASDLFWPTRTHVVTNCTSFMSKLPPRFRSYAGEGSMAVQIQNGRDTSEMAQEGLYCYLEPDPDNDKLAYCYIRIDTIGRKKPVFLKCKAVLHRPLPRGRVKWAFIDQRMAADRKKWQLRFTVESMDEYPIWEKDKWVAVHMGWKSDKNGIRMLLWEGYDGKRGSMLLPDWHCKQYEYLDDVRSDQDAQLNLAKELLSGWLKNRAVPNWMENAKKHSSKWKSHKRFTHLLDIWKDNPVPDEQSVYTIDKDPAVFNRFSVPGRINVDFVSEMEKRGYTIKVVHESKSSKYIRCMNLSVAATALYVRLSNHALVMRSSDQHLYYDVNSQASAERLLKLVDGEPLEIGTLDGLRALCERGTHLWRHHTRLAKRIVRRRNDWYRCLAKELSEQYSVLMLGRLNMKELVKSPHPEEQDEQESAVVRRSSWAATSEMARFMSEKFFLRYCEVEMKNLTRECNSCGHVHKHKTRTRKIQCINCGDTHDVDENALLNTIARGKALIADGELELKFDKHVKKKADAKDKNKKLAEARKEATKKKKEEEEAKKKKEEEADD